MRVHGNKYIKRRTNILQKDYKEYREELEEDFYGLCGYCGKNQYAFNERFEIDHFAPKKKFPERKNDYSNLVFSCSKCNKHKLNKWVTDDPYVSVKDNCGFIDPASDAFDENLHRKDSGEIYGITEIGKYMCKELKFDIRPIAMVWKVNKLNELKEKLENNETLKGLKEYKEIDKEIKSLLKDLVYKYKE